MLNSNISTNKTNNETLNNELNKKENKTMMNRNNKEARMEILKNAGINVDNFFDLSLRIPLNAEVKISVNGKEMTIGQPNFKHGISTGGDIDCVNNIKDLTPNDLALMAIEDEIVKQIFNKGYVFNSRTDGRFVTAQTFRMLEEKSYNCKTNSWEYGWNAYLNNRYPYMYTFTMMIDEVHRLAKMERSNDPEFERLSNFFTKEVVVETCNHYIRRLKKFIKNQPNRKCKGEPYCKLNKYGNVFIKDLDEKVYKPLETTLIRIRSAVNYTEIERELRKFVSLMVKLPYDTPKFCMWKDAFKGKGAFMTLNNIVKHHGVTLQNYETGENLNTYESVEYIESLLGTYKGEYWRFHELLKATIALNHFDLKESIKEIRLENAN